MHAGHIFEGLRNPHPAWQYGDIGDEADIAHELIALGPWIATEHPQFTLVRSETENRVERGALACAVRTDESKDTALFHSQIDTVQRNGCAEGLAQAACFDHCHNFGSSSSDFAGASNDGLPVAAPFRSSSLRNSPSFNPSR